MAKSKGVSGPGAGEGRAKLQQLLSRGPGGARALAASAAPGNQYVTVSDWEGQSGDGAMSSIAVVAPVDDTVTLTVGAMIVEDNNGAFGAGGFFTVLDSGVGAFVGAVGAGSGEFVAVLAGVVVVNGDAQFFAFSQSFG